MDGDQRNEFQNCWDAFNKVLECYGSTTELAELFSKLALFKAGGKFLVPGCMSWGLSDSIASTDILNIDACHELVTEMKSRSQHVRSNWFIKWGVMENTNMSQIADGCIDVVVEKGLLAHILGEPHQDQTAGEAYLSEVKRVLSKAGRYVAITLAQQDKLEFVMKTFRSGWTLKVRLINLKSSSNQTLQPFIIVATRLTPVDKLPLVNLDLSWHGASHKLQDRVTNWEFSSELARRAIAEYIKASRLILVRLDWKHHVFNTDNDELTRLFKSPDATDDDILSIPRYSGYRTNFRSDDVSPILVDDVMIIENIDSLKDKKENQLFRRLVFRRNPFFSQSEAFIKAKSSAEEVTLDYSSLRFLYHRQMVAAIILVADNLKKGISSEQMLRCLIVGLGGGLLPIFFHNHLPFREIEVVESDLEVARAARRFFGFSKFENKRMKVIIEDGLPYIQRIADSVASSSSRQHETLEIAEDLKKPADLSCDSVHVLIVDVDSEDQSSRMVCPSEKFVEDKFLLAARGALKEGGVLLIYLDSRAFAHHITFIAQLRKHFAEVYQFEPAVDERRLLIALPESKSKESDLHKAVRSFESLVKEFGPLPAGLDIEKLVQDLLRLQ